MTRGSRFESGPAGLAGLPPAVIVHGADGLRVVLALGRPVVLLSAPGAGVYGGCGWWLALIALGRREFPKAAAVDILDCADAPGAALATLRLGQSLLVLSPDAPGFAAVAAAAREVGALVLPAAPPALDLAVPGAAPRLAAWLERAPGTSAPGRDLPVRLG